MVAVVHGQLVRIVAGGAGHGQDAPGFGIAGYDGALLAVQQLVGELLQRGVDGGLHRRALRLVAGEGVLELLPEQGIGLAVELFVARRLDAAVHAVRDGEVSGDGRVDRSVAVGPLVGEWVVDRVGLGQYGAVGGQDRATGRADGVVQHARVARIRVQIIGLDGRDDGCGQSEDHEQRDDRGEQLT